MYTSYPLAVSRFFTSIATTTHWLPNLSAASVISSGVLTAEELIDILSAPSLRISRKSWTVLIPPPTVNGINTFLAVSRTTSSSMLLASELAVISRKTSSSAPALSYICAISTGSPASRRFTKLTPLTTLPP